LINDGKFKSVGMSEEHLIQLSNNLRTYGIEMVHFEKESILVEGIYIPAKGTNNSLMIIPSIEDEKE
jgi:hypothetical protein